MQPFHTFNNLTDFFTEPPNFFEFVSVRKPSQFGQLDCLSEDDLSLSLDFIQMSPKQTPSPENRLMLTDFQIPPINIEATNSVPTIVKASTEPAKKIVVQHEEKKKFYNKNSARNIVRKTIRCIEAETYEQELRNICVGFGQDYDSFCDSISNHFEEMTGPQALKKFLAQGGKVSQVFKQYLIWFLKERYVREALREGHMEDIKQYISFKNKELLPMLHSL